MNIVSIYIKSISGKFYLSSISTLLTRALSIIINLITLPLLYNSIGQVRYGILVSITAISIFSNFADLGLGFGLQSKVSKLQVESIDSLKSAINYTFSFLVFTTILLLVLCYSIASYIDWNVIFGLANDFGDKDVVLSVYIFVSILCISIPFSVAQKIQLGLQEGYKTNFWICGGNVVGLACTFLTSVYVPSVSAYVVSIYGVNAIFLVLNYLHYFYFDKIELRPKLSIIRYNLHSDLLKDSLIFFIVQISSLLLYYSNIALLLKYNGSKEVAIYNVLYRMCIIFIIPIESLGSNITPLINEITTKKGVAFTFRPIKKIVGLSILSSIIGSLTVFFVGENIIQLWINKDIQLSEDVKLSTSVFLLLYANIGCVLSYILLSNDYINRKIIIYTFAVLVAISSKPYFIVHKSISGAFWSTSLPMFLFYIIPSIFILLNHKLQNENMPILHKSSRSSN